MKKVWTLGVFLCVAILCSCGNVTKEKLGLANSSPN